MKNIVLRSRASILLALLVVALPFLNLPEVLQDSLLVIAGLLIVLLSFGKSHYVSNFDSEIKSLSPEQNLDTRSESRSEEGSISDHNQSERYE